MAVGDTSIGTGSTITFAGWSGEILSIAWGGMERAVVDTSHMGTTTWKTFLAGDLADPGEVTAECHLDGSFDVSTVLTGAAGSLAVLLGDGSTWTASSAQLTGFNFDDPLEDKMTSTFVWKVTGSIDVT